MSIWRPLLGLNREFPSLRHSDYAQSLRCAEDKCSPEPVENSRRQFLRHAPRVKGKIVISSDQGSQFPPTGPVQGRKGPGKTAPSSLSWRLNIASPKPLTEGKHDTQEKQNMASFCFCFVCFFGLFSFLHHGVCALGS